MKLLDEIIESAEKFTAEDIVSSVWCYPDHAQKVFDPDLAKDFVALLKKERDNADRLAKALKVAIEELEWAEETHEWLHVAREEGKNTLNQIQKILEGVEE